MGDISLETKTKVKIRCLHQGDERLSFHEEINCKNCIERNKYCYTPVEAIDIFVYDPDNDKT